VLEFSDKKIVESWLKNANPWIQAIENKEIESRQLVTNKAIIEAILKREPDHVLDIGCGEGWLVRKLVSRGIDCLGIDTVPELINYASKREGRFKILPYEELKPEAVGKQFDVLVCNFSLFGKRSVEIIFDQASKIVCNRGALIVQTLHPGSSFDKEVQVEGWKEGSWAGFNENFSCPAPWYYRSIESWMALFSGAGFSKVEIVEPINPKTKIPASIIFIGEMDD